MPVISMFFGIVITMFYNDHDPVHFHAEYQGQRAKFDLDGELLVGVFRSQTAQRLIREWAAAHQTEIKANWENARLGRPLMRIEPLD